MGIMSSIKKGLSSQKGSVVVMAAVCLPVLLGLGGMAVDLGNFYTHHARLQNAAESAAAAGGYAFREYKENSSSHPNADEASELYAAKNMPDKSTSKWWGDSDAKDVTMPSGATAHAYKYTLYEDVPYHFLRPLLAIFNKQDYVTISASGFCTLIDQPGSGDPFDSLFIFSDKLGSVNNVQNPDNDTIQQNYNNCSTYDGDVKAIKPNYDKDYRFDTMLNESAFGLNQYNRTPTITPTVANAINNKQVVELIEDFDYDMEAFYNDTVKKLIQNARDNNTDKCILNPCDYNNVNSSNVNQWLSNGTKAVYFDSNNLNITLDGALAGSPSDDPLYIIFEHINNLNFNADMSNSRRIIFVQAKEVINPWWEPEYREITMNSNGGEFHGILYAPYGRVFVNDNHHDFYGTVAAKNIQLQSQGYYHHEKGIVKPGNNNDDYEVVFGGADFW